MLYQREGVGSCKILWGHDWRVAPADGLKQVLADKLGIKVAAVEY